jgi:predicted ABC-type ATPase
VKNPVLIVICGPNGSGKTSITRRILKHEWIENCVYINPDDIAKDIFGDWNSPEAVINAANYAQELREKLLLERKSIIFETVLSRFDKVAFIQRAHDLGYFIRIFFVCTDSPAINASRIANRVMNGGHDVPITKIISRYAKSIVNCASIAPFVNRLYVYDNSKELKQAALLFRACDGKLIKQYHTIHPWAIHIRENLT